MTKDATFYTIIALSFLAGGVLHLAIRNLGQTLATWVLGFKLEHIVLLGVPILRPIPGWNRNRFATFVSAIPIRPSRERLVCFYVSGHTFSLTLITAAFVYFFNTRPAFSSEVIIGMLCYASIALGDLAFEIARPPSDQNQTIAQTIRNLYVYPDWDISNYEVDYALRGTEKLRPSRYPEETFDRLSRIENHPYVYWLFRYYMLMDSNRVEEARTCLQKAYELAIQHGQLTRFTISIFYETAMYTARFENNFKISTEAFQKAKKLSKDDPTRFGAVAARAFAKSHLSFASSLLTKSLRIHRNNFNDLPEIYDHILEWAERIVPGFTETLPEELKSFSDTRTV
jgi:tetratricopeptide (TPR) repeat protein